MLFLNKKREGLKKNECTRTSFLLNPSSKNTNIISLTNNKARGEQINEGER